MTLNFYWVKNKVVMLFSLLLFISGYSVVFAQSGSLRGSVYDKSTNESLTGANVIVKGTSLGAATDLDGDFIIRNIPVGNYTIVVSYIGYDESTSEVTVVANKSISLEFYLSSTTIGGEEIVITGQAQGQLQAINQQLSSDKVANIVSEARIQELPDFNAAAAIGRLPGVSTLQSSGEANKIVIRGLAPQYNQVTVGGISLASTGSTQIGATSQGGTAGTISNDRSVDLTAVTPYMLKSISVYKSLTPDLNANSLGGTVNMELREAPSELHTDLLWQSGYTAKSSTYGNYRAVASVSTRFFDDKLGVYALGNIEAYDRDADNMNASYIVTDSKAINENGYLPVKVSSLNLVRHTETRNRYGGNLIFDYRLPTGSIKFINMFSRLNSDYKDYTVIHNHATNDLGFRYREGENTVDAAINSISISNDFGFIETDIKIANTYSRNNLPRSPEVIFNQTNGVQNSTDDTVPEELKNTVTFGGYDQSYLQRLSLYSSDYKENGQTYKGDFKVPFNINSDISGYIKFGGEYQYKQHKNAQTTPYMNMQGGSDISNTILDGINQEFPGLSYDAGQHRYTIGSFVSNDSKLTDKFLDDKFGNFILAINPSVFNGIIDYIANTPAYSANNSTGQNAGGWYLGNYQIYPNQYKYIERYYAGYLMSEIKYGGFMIVGGVRYEKEKSLFEAFNLADARGDPKTQKVFPVTVYPENEFFLPMVQTKFDIAKWVDVRYAYTQTLARPDYHQLSPHYNIAYTKNTVYAGNPDLGVAHAYNHDLIFSFHSNELGLLSVGGFYKEIKDFTYSTHYSLLASNAAIGLKTVEDFSVGGVLPNEKADLYTYYNSPYLAFVRGLEVDLQTRLWYLPTPLNGIVLGINYTRIWSKATYPWRDSRTTKDRPPVAYVLDSTRTGRLINQPNDIVNGYIGYDYLDFSARISLIFQGNSVSGIGSFEEQDGFSRDYFRVDASVKQRLPWANIEVFLDLNNINSETNQSAQQSIGGFTSEQNYGLTANLGVRYRL